MSLPYENTESIFGQKGIELNDFPESPLLTRGALFTNPTVSHMGACTVDITPPQVFFFVPYGQ